LLLAVDEAADDIAQDGPAKTSARRIEGGAQMINTMTTTVTMSQAAGFAMPASVRDRIASVRVPSTGVVGGVTAGSRTVEASIQGTAVCGYGHINDAVAVLKGAFPGTSAWSPPT